MSPNEIRARLARQGCIVARVNAAPPHGPPRARLVAQAARVAASLRDDPAARFAFLHFGAIAARAVLEERELARDPRVIAMMRAGK